MNNDTDKNDMNAAMAFLVDKLKSGKANVSDLGVILADTYRQTDHQSKVLDQQTKDIHTLNNKMDDLEPAVKSLLEDQKRIRWVVRGVVSVVTAFGLGIAGWVMTSGQSIAYALSVDEQRIKEIARTEVTNTEQHIIKKIEEQKAETREWINNSFLRR